jgi:hypothetical protein
MIAAALAEHFDCDATAVLADVRGVLDSFQTLGLLAIAQSS